MNFGRWYPTAVCLPDRGVLVCSGTMEDGKFNTKPQIWEDNRWNDSFEFNDLPWYPRLHVETNGSVFMSGPLNLTQSLNSAMGGGWTQVGKRNGGDGFNALMEYGSPVMFAKGKILFIGGGDRPIDAVKVIDLDGDRVWKDAIRITGELTVTDGFHEKKEFEIIANLDGDFIKICISAKEFNRMDWVVSDLGARAVIYASQGVKEHLRAAIQLLSLDGMSRREVHEHTGWVKERGRLWYLHAGGAIGADLSAHPGRRRRSGLLPR
jgi:hypothetical protein